MCIRGPPSDQKSRMQRAASDVKSHPSAPQQMSLFNPFLAHSLPALALLLSLFFSIPFFSAPTLKPGDWRGFGRTCGAAETRSKNQCAFGKASGDSGLSMELSLILSLVVLLWPDIRQPLAPFYSLYSLHLSLFQGKYMHTLR